MLSIPCSPVTLCRYCNTACVFGPQGSLWYLTCCLVEPLHGYSNISLEGLLMTSSDIFNVALISNSLHPALLQNVLLCITVIVIDLLSIHNTHCNKFWKLFHASGCCVEVLQTVGHWNTKQTKLILPQVITLQRLTYIYYDILSILSMFIKKCAVYDLYFPIGQYIYINVLVKLNVLNFMAFSEMYELMHNKIPINRVIWEQPIMLHILVKFKHSLKSFLFSWCGWFIRGQWKLINRLLIFFFYHFLSISVLKNTCSVLHNLQQGIQLYFKSDNHSQVNKVILWCNEPTTTTLILLYYSELSIFKHKW